MLIPLLLLLAAATPAPKHTPTVKATPGPQTQAARAEYRTADAAMANQWRITNAFMKGKDALIKTRGGGFGYAAALLESQRAWLHYRDTACAVEGGVHAGDVRQALIVAQCKTALTNARRLQLKGLMVTE